MNDRSPWRIALGWTLVWWVLAVNLDRCYLYFLPRWYGPSIPGLGGLPAISIWSILAVGAALAAARRARRQVTP